MNQIFKFLLIYSVVLSTSTDYVNGQNLVLNPGFDSYITCPGFGQFSNVYINDWNKPTVGSTDYFHYNCAGIQPSVQVPRSGEGYAGIYSYNYGTEYREYITGTLSSPLVAGQTYDVEFYVSLNDGYIQAIVEMGAYLSATAPGPFSNALHLNLIPQIENTSGPLQDTTFWKRVSGQIVAQGGEQFITIGNFHNDTTTTISQPGTTGSYGAYYFIEDVSVRLDSTTSLNTFPLILQPEIFVSHGNILQMNLPQKNQYKLYCYNTSGLLVAERIWNDTYFQIDLCHLADGVYFVVIEDSKGKKYSKKIVLTDLSD
ncbi:MAG TPA: T9SS type A sorting domain-containing protein [Bacteroidia bacterium]|nr:T9SS type A sorting domain-containing protein [Bacteroidia bacterium]